MTSTYLILAALLFAPIAHAKVVDRIVAQVNDDIITLSDVNREMASIRQQLAAQYSGDQLEQEIKKAEKAALDSLIQEKLLLQKALELGFTANVDVQVSAAIEQIKKENGLKDNQELERALSQTGESLANFRERIRRSIIVRSLVNEFVGSRITLLTNDIEKYYKEHQAEFTTPGEVTLSEIVIPFEGSPAEAEAKAEDVRKRTTAGEAFATLASQYSKGPTASKGGGIGSYPTGKLNAEIARAIANVADGEVTPVLKGKDAYVIYRVDSRKAAAVAPLEEVKKPIQQRLWEERFNPEMERFVAQLKEDAYIQIFSETK